MAYLFIIKLLFLCVKVLGGNKKTTKDRNNKIL